MYSPPGIVYQPFLNGILRTAILKKVNKSPSERSLGYFALGAVKGAGGQVVVHHAHCLHKGIYDNGAHKAKAPFF